MDVWAFNSVRHQWYVRVKYVSIRCFWWSSEHSFIDVYRTESTGRPKRTAVYEIAFYWRVHASYGHLRCFPVNGSNGCDTRTVLDIDSVTTTTVFHDLDVAGRSAYVRWITFTDVVKEFSALQRLTLSMAQDCSNVAAISINHVGS